MDFKHTIIELMSQTDNTVDLSSYIQQMEAILSNGILTAFGGRVTGRFCETKEIKQIANEPPLDGRNFRGEVMLDGKWFEYDISFRVKNTVRLCIYAKDNTISSQIPSANILRDGEFNQTFNAIYNIVHSVKSVEAEAIYYKIPDELTTQISEKAVALKKALDEAKANLLIIDRGNDVDMYIVPNEVEIADGSCPYDAIDLNPNNFALIDLPTKLSRSDDDSYFVRGND